MNLHLIKKIENFGYLSISNNFIVGKQHLGNSIFCITILHKKELYLLKKWELANTERFIAIDEKEKSVFCMDYDFNIHRLDYFNSNKIILKNMFLLGNWDFEGKILIDDRQNEQICIFDANTN